jgi:mannose-1-phosphate guanylyltransferase
MTKPSEKYFCLILAGGTGSRLWPASREHFPKQFMDFAGTGRTLIQQTYDRFARFIRPENIFVSTLQSYTSILQEQLPQLPREQILEEPVRRGTLAPVTWATTVILRRCPEACIVLSPSDQVIYGDDQFDNDLMHAFQTMEHHNGVVNMGVPPTRPETGYGYVQMGESIEEEQRIYRVKTFTEKPDEHFAQMFMESGEFLWNTGLIVASADTLRRCVRRIYARHFSEALPEEHDYTIEWVMNFVENKYASLPNIPIDSGMLEMCDNVYVMQCDFGWADLGTWHSIYECMGHGEGDNVIINSEVIIEDSRNNVIKLPKDHLAVINGLDGYIVAEQGNVLLICKKSDSSALIRKYVNEVHIKYGDEFI